jgi:heat-inducible transcriptional repressor
VLVVLVTADGATVRRVVNDPAPSAQPELERMAVLLNERLVGSTLGEVRVRLAVEAEALRSRVDILLGHAIALALSAIPADLEAQDDAGDLVIATRLALLDQPEFHDPERLRELYRAVEDRERLVQMLDHMLETGGVSVRLGAEVEEPALRHCAVVAASWGVGGVLGVIGPSRMDYGRVIPLVDTLSHLMTEKLYA